MDNKLLASPKEIKFFFSLGAILIVLIIIVFVLGMKTVPEKISDEVPVDPFASVSLVAKSAIVFDVRTGKVLFNKNAEERLPLASITKLMTALVARSSASETTVVTIPARAILAEGDSGLRVGERWTLGSLVDFLLTTSSNDGATALALVFGTKQDFVNLMNIKANEIGMKNTYYFNETGIDESMEKGGAYGTARDTATLFSYILKNYPNLLSATSEPKFEITSLDGIVHVAKNTDLITENVPSMKGSKTGFTDLAGGNLVIAFDPEIGRPIVIVVLSSTAEDRFVDVEKLVKASLKSIQNL
jgi:D-alanyl-D-alanine carboxypeptidase (penicillin-binding protein 5/6)